VSKLFSPKVLVPLCLLTCIVLVSLVSPMTWATGLLLLIVGTVVPVVAFVLCKVPPPTIAEVLNRVERSTTRF
jgi:hypothetical protein